MADAATPEGEPVEARAEDVLALVAARTKLGRSVKARDELQEQCSVLRDKLQQQAHEQVRGCAESSGVLKFRVPG
jgi:hypothetical protein